MSLRDVATNAKQSQIDNRKQREAKELASKAIVVCRMLKDDFNIEATPTDNGTATCDGIEFSSMETGYGLHIAARVSAESEFKYIYSIEDIGDLIIKHEEQLEQDRVIEDALKHRSPTSVELAEQYARVGKYREAIVYALISIAESLFEQRMDSIQF